MSSMDINIRFELRPCLVNGEKMLFHMWTTLAGKTVAVVEDSNGVVILVSPLDIVFTDELFKEYIFEDGEEK